MSNLVPPVTYQGGKQRIAGQILDIINPFRKPLFYDLCCGSGAVSIELVNRGFSPAQIVMVDQSPWGLFWNLVGNGSFDLLKFKTILSDIPKDLSEIQGYIKKLSKQPADQDTVYVYLILQAASFGGKAIWIGDNKWRNCSFRSYWLPTATSNRRSPVNPMMPMPDTLFKRVELICSKMFGVTGIHADANEIKPSKGIVYIDPPYENTTFYGHSFDALKYTQALDVSCYISEGKPLNPLDEYNWLISKGRKKGGISAERKTPNEEWLSYYGHS